MELSLALTDDAADHLIENGTTPKSGARGLRRVIEEKIEDSVADLILDDKLTQGGKVLIDFNADEGRLTFEVAEEAEATSSVA